MQRSKMKTKRLLEKLISQFPSKSTPFLSFSTPPTLPTRPKTKTKKALFKTKPPIQSQATFRPDMLLDLRLLTKQEYEQSGIAVKAIQDFRTMLEHGNCMAHNVALIILVEEEMFNVAMAIYGDMLKRNPPRDCGTFNSVIAGLGKAGKMQDAIQLFDEMAEMGISPDATTYTNLLNGFCKFHRMDEAFMFLGSFLKKGYRVTLNVYSCVIDGLFGAGRFEEACKCYGNNFLKDENVSPDTKLHRIMIKGYTEAGKIDDAFAILTEMCSGSLVSSLSLDIYSYSILLKHLIDVGLWNRSQLLVKDYILKHEPIFNSPIHAILIGWLCKAGFVNEAQEIFDKMVVFGRFPAVMAFGAVEIHKARFRLKMKKMEMEMERNPYPSSQGMDWFDNLESYMIGRLCKAGFVQEAQEIFDKMVVFGRFVAVMAFSALEVHKARLRLKMMEMEKNKEGFERLRHGNKAIEMQCVLDLFNFDDD